MRQWLITEEEAEALHGVPHTAQVGYMRGIRPYMDRETGLVGIKGAISYAFIATHCEVAPKRGRHQGHECRPTKKMGRHIVDELEAEGLVQRINCDDSRRLVLNCLLAPTDQSVSRMRGTRGAHEGHTYEGHTETRSCKGNGADEGPYEGHTKKDHEGHTSVISNSVKRNPPKSPLEFPDWLPMDAWSAFVGMRNRIKKPLTDRAVELAIGKLDKLRQAGEDVEAVINQSVFCDWQTFYPLKKESATKKQIHEKEFRSAGPGEW